MLQFLNNNPDIAKCILHEIPEHERSAISEILSSAYQWEFEIRKRPTRLKISITGMRYGVTKQRLVVIRNQDLAALLVEYILQRPMLQDKTNSNAFYRALTEGGWEIMDTPLETMMNFSLHVAHSKHTAWLNFYKHQFSFSTRVGRGSNRYVRGSLAY